MDHLFVIWIAIGMFARTKSQTCNSLLLDTVSDSQLTASSIYGPTYIASAARLSRIGWSPNANEPAPWIQVDFGFQTIIVAVVTKGLSDASLKEWVKKYRVMYGDDTSTLTTVITGATNEFTANSDPNTAVTNPLPTSVTARYLRLYPTEFSNYRSLRFDLIGCQVPTTTSPTTTTPTTTTSTTTSTTMTTTTTYLTTTTVPTTTTTKFTSTATSPSEPSTIPPEPSTIPPEPSTISSTGTKWNSCLCACPHTNQSLTPQELQTKIQKIVKELTVPKKTLSSFIRSKTSASDDRPQAMYVGTVAIAILCIIVSLIILPDVILLFRFFYIYLKGVEGSHNF